MARTFSCKDCGTAGFKSAWDVRHHKIEQHGAPARGKATRATRTTRSPRRAAARGDEKRPKRKYTRHAEPRPPASTEPVVATGIDPEAELLCKVLSAFASAGTDRDADFRVLEYVAQRFGPAAYEGEETE